MSEALGTAIIIIVIAQFIALWYKVGKVEQKLCNHIGKEKNSGSNN